MHIVYLDDFNTVGTQRVLVNSESRRIATTLEAHNLLEATTKRQVASRDHPGVAIGLWWWIEGVLTVRPALARALLNHTEAILARGTSSPKEMQSILGRWTWACLLRRNFLSTLNKVYSLTSLDRPSRRRNLSVQQRVELEMLLDLFPLMCADLRGHESTRVYATDACKTGERHTATCRSRVWIKFWAASARLKFRWAGNLHCRARRSLQPSWNKRTHPVASTPSRSRKISRRLLPRKFEDGHCHLVADQAAY